MWVNDREDYPDCVFCGKKTTWSGFCDTGKLLVFYCGECCQSVEVDIGTDNEELLRDPGSR